MHTDSQKAANPPPLVRFGRFRHAMVGSILSVLVVLMMSACSDEEPEQDVESQADKPGEANVVQVPASQWPGQYVPQSYIAPQVQQPWVAPPVQQPQAPVSTNGNPWAVKTQPRSYRRQPTQQWGQPQPRPPQYGQPQYVQPQHAQPQYGQPQYRQQQYGQQQHTQQQYAQPQYVQPQYVQPQYAQPQYRPLEPETAVKAPRAPAVQQPVQSYRPVAPYDRLSGSSFGTPGVPVAPGYPYGGGYPGTYGSGLYGAPGGVYAPGWPGPW